MQQKILDTNILVRFLLNDNEKQVDKIEQLFNLSSFSSLIIPDLVIAEVIFVLLSVYKYEKKVVIDHIESLLHTEIFVTNKTLISQALYLFKTNTISFVDAYLCAQSIVEQKSLVTFDKRLQKIENVVIEKI